MNIGLGGYSQFRKEFVAILNHLVARSESVPEVLVLFIRQVVEPLEQFFLHLSMECESISPLVLNETPRCVNCLENNEGDICTKEAPDSRRITWDLLRKEHVRAGDVTHSEEAE